MTDETKMRDQTGSGSGKLIDDLKSWKQRGCGESASERTPQQIKDDAYCDGWLDGFASTHQSATEQMRPLAEELERYALYDRLGKRITHGCVVHWTDGGDDLPLEKRIESRWDRIAVTELSANTGFRVIDSPSDKVKQAGHTFRMGNFIYVETHKYLTVVADSEEEYHSKFQSAGDCMRWVTQALATIEQPFTKSEAEHG